MAKSQLNMLSKNVKSQQDDFKGHLVQLFCDEQEFIYHVFGETAGHSNEPVCSQMSSCGDLSTELT